MLKEETLPILEIAKIHEGLQNLMSSEKEGNYFPIKIAFLIGSWMDSIDPIQKNYQKEAQKAYLLSQEKANKFPEELKQAKINELFQKEIESLNKQSFTIKVPVSKISLSEFGEVKIPSIAFKYLNQFIEP